MRISRTIQRQGWAVVEGGQAVQDLGRRLPDAVRESARTVTTELIRRSAVDDGSAVEEGIGVTIDVSSDRIRIEVTDRDRPVKAPPNWDKVVIEHLADRWGTRDSCMWAEIDLRARL